MQTRGPFQALGAWFPEPLAATDRIALSLCRIFYLPVRKEQSLEHTRLAKLCSRRSLVRPPQSLDNRRSDKFVENAKKVDWHTEKDTIH